MVISGLGERATNGSFMENYMQDKWTTLAHGWPSHLSDDYGIGTDLDITDFGAP